MANSTAIESFVKMLDEIKNMDDIQRAYLVQASCSESKIGESLARKILTPFVGGKEEFDRLLNLKS